MPKSSSAKGTAGKPAKRVNRRAEIRRNLPKPAFDYKSIISRPAFVMAAGILLVYVMLASSTVNWSRDQVRVRDGQIMTETRVRRLSYELPNAQATEDARASVRKAAPLVYKVNVDYLNRLRTSLTGLPEAVANDSDISEVPPELVSRFGLTQEALVALQGQRDANGEPSEAWNKAINNLLDVQLFARPILNSDDYVKYAMRAKALATGEDDIDETFNPQAVELHANGRVPEEELKKFATNAGFQPALIKTVVAALQTDSEATFVLDQEQTDTYADRLVGQVAPKMSKYGEGEVIYQRGEVLSLDKYQEVVEEAQQYRSHTTIGRQWTPRMGLAGICLLMVLLVTGFGAANYPHLARNPIRIAALCALSLAMLGIAVVVTQRAPGFLYGAGIATTLFTVVLVLLAYDQRLAAVAGVLQTAMVTLALEQSIGWFILVLVGCGAMIAQLREVRHRSSLIMAATGTAVVLAVGVLMIGLAEYPLAARGVWASIFANIGMAVGASFVVGFLVLGILPSIERLLNLTTGMTLAELRDPKQTLLRQLQQRAPGTYNHSLQVANICEAAAEAIGANGLLVYVAALYHDIGKLNKPEYFIENQADGYNKHDKLSPAMSLLVIIGHVKDGIELAREYNLPRPLIHFIESHHGTTLVEYFYHAAKTQAEAEAKETVDEVVFRYPGPKPHTREAAILMLADAVESATRAMAEPNPSRIESLVRELSAKRLADGQFDQCPLTFRELGQIEDAIISRVLAIYHGRISYPSSAKPAEPGDTRAAGTDAGRGTGTGTGTGNGRGPGSGEPPAPTAKPASA